MTDPGDGQPTFDPRYDRRFQPGYVPAEGGGPEIRSSAPDEPEATVAEARVCPEVENSEPTAEEAEPAAEGTASGAVGGRFNRFHLVLWLYGAFFTFASVGFRVLLGSGFGNNGPTAEILPNLFWNVSPLMLPSSLFAIVGVTFLSAIGRRRPLQGASARHPAISLPWPVHLGLWLLALALIAAAGVSEVWKIRESAMNSTGSGMSLDGFFLAIVLDSVAQALFLAGWLAMIALVVLGIRRRMHGEFNPWLRGLWIGSVLAVIVSTFLLIRQVPEATADGFAASGTFVPDLGEAWVTSVVIAAPTVLELSLITIVALLMFHAWTWPRRESDLSGRVRPFKST